MPPLARTTPVTPPMVNMKMNPSAHNSGVLKLSEPPQSVANQENTLMPVGTAITMDAAVKYIFRLIDMPTVNMWCAQTNAFGMGQPSDIANMVRSEEHTSELQSLMRISYAVFCLKKKTQQQNNTIS